MDASSLLSGVLRSVLGGRRKRSTRALRYLTGSRGGSFLSNPATLLAAAGVAWGIYETLKPRVQPGAPVSPGTVPPPPVPRGAAAPTAASDDALRMVRLAVSAAHADGAMNEHERAAILQQASAAGVSAVVEQELAHVRPLADIVAGVSDPAERATLYVLAFTIIRADEGMSGAERIYLAQLAHLLGLDAAEVQQLENDAGDRIDALGDQGQLGG